MTRQCESKPFVSVVVPVHRNRSGLRSCLDALAKQTYPGSRFEIIVIDNGGNGDLEALAAEYSNLRLCHEGIPGSYVARNTGVNRVRGAVIAFTDSDCIPDSSWLTAGVETLAGDPSADVIGGEVEVFARDARSLNTFETHQVVKGFYSEIAIRAENRATTANLFTYREVFEKVGPFRADFQSGGDSEWCRRAVRFGYSLVYAPKAVVFHPARWTFLDFSLRYIRTTGGTFCWKRAEGLAPLSLRRAAGYMTPPIGETRRNEGHPALRARFGRMKFFLAEYWLRAIRLVETLRLLLGGSPIRY